MSAPAKALSVSSTASLAPRRVRFSRKAAVFSGPILRIVTSAPFILSAVSYALASNGLISPSADCLIQTTTFIFTSQNKSGLTRRGFSCIQRKPLGIFRYFRDLV